MPDFNDHAGIEKALDALLCAAHELDLQKAANPSSPVLTRMSVYGDEPIETNRVDIVDHAWDGLGEGDDRWWR